MTLSRTHAEASGPVPADASLTEYSRNVYIRTLRLRPLSASQIQTLPGAALRGATWLRSRTMPSSG